MTTTMGPSLTVLDVGHGSCAVLLETGRSVVFDAGPKSGLLEHLRETEITTLDLVLISHADQDHIRGLLAILGTNSINIKTIRLNTDSEKGSKVWDDLLWELDQLQQSGKIKFSPALTHADNGQFDSADVKIEILAPSAYLAAKGPKSTDRDGRRISSNSISAVIKIYYQGQPVVLLTGDLDDIGLDDLIRTRQSMEAPILIFPHHGGHSGAQDMGAFAVKLLDKVKPNQVLFSIGRGLHGTPIPAVITAAKRNIAGVRISCTELSEHCSAAVPKTDHEHISSVFAQGRDSRSCCAGSITIHLEGRTTAFPIWNDHQNFITSSAPTALCRL